MGIQAELVGNVLQTPTLKNINVKGEDRLIAELRIMASSYRRENDGTLTQIDGKTFPVDVTVWHEATAQRIVKHIKTGASVVVKGPLFVNPWVDADSTPHAGVRMDGETISLNLHRVERIEFRARQARSSEEVPTEFDR